MKYKLLYVFLINSIVSAKNEYNLIEDYFINREVKSIVGFSCSSAQDDFSLIKSLNEHGVMTIIRKLNDDHQISDLAFSNYWKLGVFLDIRCYSTTSIVSLFSNSSKLRIYDELHYWFVIGSNINNLASLIVDDAFGLSTDFVIAIPLVNHKLDGDFEENYELYDVYNIWKDRGSELNLTFLGFWNKLKGLNINLEGTKFHRRANLHGMTLKTSFLKSKYKPTHLSLENYLQDHATSTKDGLSKFGFVVVNHLSEMFNFKLQYSIASVWKAGDTIGPVIRALMDKEIDISGSPATMNVKRTYMVKYVHQSWPFRTCFIFRSPQQKNIKINEILGPFDIHVWYLMILFFLLSVFIVSSVFRYENSESSAEYISDSILINIGAMCQQGTTMQMNLISTRLAFLCILISSLIIYNYYSASIVSVRLNEPIYKMNDSLNELAKSSLKFSSEYMIYLEFIFKRPDWEIQTFYQKIWKELPESDKFVEPEKAIELVRKGGYAYHSHPEVSYPLIGRFYDNREICELTEVHLAKPTWSTFAVSYNSTFTEMMKIGLMKISEVGLRQRQLKRWRSRKPQCETNILSASSLNIYEFAPHLIILIIGMGLAGVIYILEKYKNQI